MSSSALSSPAKAVSRAVSTVATGGIAPLLGLTGATRKLRDKIEKPIERAIEGPQVSKQPTRGEAGVGTFRSSDIKSFEQAGSLLAGRQGDIRSDAPTTTTGGDIGAVEGQEKVNRLISLFSGRQSEIARRRRQPGRGLLTGAGAA